MSQEKRDYAERHFREHVEGAELIEQALADLLVAKLAYEAAEREQDPIRRYYRKNDTAAQYVEAWDRITDLGYTPIWDKEANRYRAVEANR